MDIYKKNKRGDSLLNTIINKLPIKLHLPGYNYCGSGIKLAEWLALGDQGINPLDAACKVHDIAYSQNHKNLETRHAADKVFADKSWEKVKAKDAEFGEKAAAYFITNAMKLKTKLGKDLKVKSKMTPLSSIVKVASKSVTPGKSPESIINAAPRAFKSAVKKAGGKI